MITIIGPSDGKIGDVDALKKVHDLVCRRFLATPDAKFESTAFKLAAGNGFRSSFEDPDLVGKPSKPGHYKVASPATMLTNDGIVLQATLFTDERSGATFKEAVQILESVKLPGRSTKAVEFETTENTLIISVPSLDARICIPRKGFSSSKSKFTQNESYFSFSREDGVFISGWLEPISKYPGFKKMWAEDKAKSTAGMGTEVVDEKFETINGWDVVTYSLAVPGGYTQKNLRACRIWGNTWADVHFSVTGKTPNLELLRKLLFTVKIEANQAKSSAF